LPPLRIKDTVFYGLGYCGQEIDNEMEELAKKIPRSPNTRNVLLMHVGIAGKMDAVPGVKLSSMNPLRQKIDYVGLGHFHLQFECDGWIFNPGSSEINSSIESQFTRGVYLVEFEENVKKPNSKSLPLINRRYYYKNLVLCSSLSNFDEMLAFILVQLQTDSKIPQINMNKDDRNIPVLFLILKGGLKWNFSESIQKKLHQIILQTVNVVDVKIINHIHRVSHSLDLFLQ
jgi:DNA repair exonuclease SbcCD nuclease subunit